MKSIQTFVHELTKKLVLFTNYIIWFIVDPSKFKPINNKNIKRVVIIHEGAIGELIMASSLLPPLKRVLNCKIDFIVKNGRGDILKQNPNLEKVYSLTKDFQLDKELLKKQNYDLAIILYPGGTRMANLCKKAGINYRIGCFPKTLDPCFGFTRRVFPIKSKHSVDLNLDMLKLLRIYEKKPEIKVYYSKNNLRKVKGYLKKKEIKDYFIIHPGFGNIAKNKYPSRLWELEKYAEVAEVLCKKYGMKCLLEGSKEESPLIKKIKKISNNKNIVDVSGMFSIQEIVCLSKNAKLIIEPSTSIGHIASTFDIPIITLMGRADPKEWCPLSKNSRVIVHKEVCTGCNLDNCRKRTIECMKSIKVNEVINAADELLK